MRATLRPCVAVSKQGQTQRYLAAFHECDYRLVSDLLPEVQFEVQESLNQQDVGQILSFGQLSERFRIPLRLPLSLQHFRILAFAFALIDLHWPFFVPWPKAKVYWLLVYVFMKLSSILISDDQIIRCLRSDLFGCKVCATDEIND